MEDFFTIVFCFLQEISIKQPTDEKDETFELTFFTI